MDNAPVPAVLSLKHRILCSDNSWGRGKVKVLLKDCGKLTKDLYL